jgi:hypothetical protein
MARTGDERVAPLRRLWRYGAPYRRRTGWAATHSVLNKLFDLAPLLIGLAVDVVANDGDATTATSRSWSTPGSRSAPPAT